MERDKTKLEQSFVATEDGVFQKTKNRILFVKNNGNQWQRISFFGVGLWITALWFGVFIMLFAKRKGRMMQALVRGIKAGFTQ